METGRAWREQEQEQSDKMSHFSDKNDNNNNNNTTSDHGDVDDDEDESMASFAWVTLVMLQKSYVCGALVLGQSLRNHNTKADMICMVTDDIISDITLKTALESVWDYLVVVDKIEASVSVQQRRQSRFGHMYDPWLKYCLTKFNAFALVRYNKIAFLDADMLCVAPPDDDLIRIEAPAGVCDSLRFEDLEAQRRMHGKELPRREVVRSLTGNHYAISGSLLLFEPDLEVHEEIKRLSRVAMIGHPQAMAGPDEYFIAKFFLDRNVPWRHLHKRFAHVSWSVEASLRGQVAPVFLHYVSEKPWSGPEKVTGNWPDFIEWDKVASQVESLAPQLFISWRARNSLPLSEREEK